MAATLLARIFSTAKKILRMTPKISVVIPAFNAEITIADAVRAVMTQPLLPGTFECIVVDDGSTDRTAEFAKKAGAVVIRLSRNVGIAAARNAGIEQARGNWIAFTDADCVPSRRWLNLILAEAEKVDASIIAIAGKILGLNSQTPAARFVDLIGGLDAETYLQHATAPWATSSNVAYRRENLQAIGGFDAALKSYESADLQLRLQARFGGRISYLPAALVLHRHRATWRSFWKQQRGYGIGYAQFILKHSDRWSWSIQNEMDAWRRIATNAAQACLARGDKSLVHRGWCIKLLAQRVGFLSEYFSHRRPKHICVAKPA
jgi:glycosyltransferase involved in cell wall biosynthesis